MDSIDHIAIQTESIKDSISWYKNMFSCEVEFEDDTWELGKFENTKLALVVPSQHPAHIAIKRDNLEKFGSPIKHRDGSESVYVKSPDSNTFELIRYPK